MDSSFQEKPLELTGKDGHELFARTWQAGESVTAEIGIVHGMGEHSGRYADVANYLCRAGYRVSAYDQRGHGRTAGRRGDVSSYDLLLDDLDEFVSRLRAHMVDSKLFLYGHSFGGNVVLNYALRRKPALSGLVITSPLLRPTKTPPLWKRLFAHTCYRICPAFRLPMGIDSRGLSHDRKVVQAYKTDMLNHSVISARLAVETLDAGEWALVHARELELPLLLMHGSFDAITSSAASREFAENVESSCLFKLWPGLFHELHNEPERLEVLEMIAGWLQTFTMTPESFGVKDSKEEE
ncbi:MAG TPA: lysophospholipase [Planctomycetaceae bacterium]|nr:lysophospholipase [Planctomycetaceae bacterium]